MNAAFAKKLKAAKKLWQGARDRASEGPDFEEIPDGRYLFKLKGAELAESQSSGRAQVNWTWAVLDGEYEGKTKMDFDGIESEDNLMYLARKLSKLGCDLEDLDELEKTLKELVREKPVVRARLKTKGEFQNFYIDKLVDADEIDEDEDEDEDEKPAPRKSKPKPKPEDDEEEEEEDDEAEESDEDEAEDEDEDEDEKEVDLEVGMRVTAGKGKKKVTGKVVKIAKDGTTINIKDDDGTIHKNVSVDGLELADEAEADEDEDEDEEVPEKPSRVTKAKGGKSRR